MRNYCIQNRQCRLIPERRETNEVIPTATPTFCRKVIFRPQTQGRTLIEPGSLAKLGGRLEFRETESAGICEGDAHGGQEEKGSRNLPWGLLEALLNIKPHSRRRGKKWQGVVI